MSVFGHLQVELFDHRSHEVKSFACGKEIMDRWIRRFAKRSQRDDLTRVFVLVKRASEESGEPGNKNKNKNKNKKNKKKVLGYFALSMGHIHFEDLTEEDRERLPRYPIPAVLLTRLAVSSELQGRGAGGALLYSASKRAMMASRHVAARVMVVEVLDEEAFGFYGHYGFVRMPSDDERVYISLERMRGVLG